MIRIEVTYPSPQPWKKIPRIQVVLPRNRLSALIDSSYKNVQDKQPADNKAQSLFFRINAKKNNSFVCLGRDLALNREN